MDITNIEKQLKKLFLDIMLDEQHYHLLGERPHSYTTRALALWDYMQKGIKEEVFADRPEYRIVFHSPVCTITNFSYNGIYCKYNDKSVLYYRDGKVRNSINAPISDIDKYRSAFYSVTRAYLGIADRAYVEARKKYRLGYDCVTPEMIEQIIEMCDRRTMFLKKPDKNAQQIYLEDVAQLEELILFAIADVLDRYSFTNIEIGAQFMDFPFDYWTNYADADIPHAEIWFTITQRKAQSAKQSIQYKTRIGRNCNLIKNKGQEFLGPYQDIFEQSMTDFMYNLSNYIKIIFQKKGLPHV